MTGNNGSAQTLFHWNDVELLKIADRDKIDTHAHIYL